MQSNHPDSLTGTRLLEHKGVLFRKTRRCRLRVVSGPDKGKEQEFSRPVLTIGALADCAFVLTDSAVSGLHLEIALGEGGFVTRDLGSTNGTYLGEARIGEIVIRKKTTLSLGETVMEFSPLAEEDEEEIPARSQLGELLGQSISMQSMFHTIEQVAPSKTTVLITGETGTGKELAAECIHSLSDRADKPFVVVDCTAISPGLFESEIFGHERGAFTGAVSAHQGAFERADGGTLFLDEISELDLSLQPKILRALERRRIQRVGATSFRDVDVRVVAACRRDLGEEVRQGRFRDDLYYRLAVVRIHVPPLRERREDIPLLASHFIAQASEDGAIDPSEHLSRDALGRLLAHDWPGNVRELRNAIDRALVLEQDPLMETEVTPPSQATPDDSMTRLPFSVAKALTIEQFEGSYVRSLLQRYDGNISACARAAGMDRRNFRRLLRRHDIRSSGR